MDLSKLISSDLVAELDGKTAKNISKEDISKVLVAAMPSIMANAGAKKDDAEETEAPTRGAADKKGATDVLFSLLGDNSAQVTESVAESTGVSKKGVSSILTMAAPFLLKYILGGNSSSSNNSHSNAGGGLDGLSMIMGLLGNKKDDEKPSNTLELKEEDKKDEGNGLGSLLNIATSILGSK